jgi:hypothetical protein
MTGSIMYIENTSSSKKIMIIPNIIPKALVTFPMFTSHYLVYISNCAWDEPFSINIPSLRSTLSPILLLKKPDLPE